MRHIIGILLQNESGALSRVAGLFSSRGYNIESLSVATTEDPTVSRVTLVTTGSEAVIQQIVNQLNKLIDVLTVDDMTGGDHLERELVLVKLRLSPEQRELATRHVTQAGGRVLNTDPESFIVELSANEADASRFMRDAARFGELLEVVRSGALGISRRARSLHLVSDVAVSGAATEV
ncbi:MAG: hypothetical protein RL030_957 [Pseudomonadota bacterium]|jgi:acetolactate synthase-1/3 small subunit